MAKTRIFIDAGHGGKDSGAKGNGLTEAELTLDIAKRIKKYLKRHYSGHIIKMSRVTNRFVSLTERASIANKWGADYFLSIHINSGGGTGFESYIYNGNVSDQTRSAQSTIHNDIINELDVKDRGKKRENLAVVRQTTMSALLTENLFIDNTADAKKLTSNSFKNKLAKAHAEGVGEVFDLHRKTREGLSVSKAKKLQKQMNELKKELAKKANKQSNGSEPSPVHEESWNQVTNLGLTNGVRPQQNMTREQYATMTTRLYEQYIKMPTWMQKEMAEKLVNIEPYLDKPERWKQDLKNGDVTTPEMLFMLISAYLNEKEAQEEK